MNTTTKITIIVIFVVISFTALCASQMVARDSLSHYLCWLVVIVSGGYAARFYVQSFESKE